MLIFIECIRLPKLQTKLTLRSPIVGSATSLQNHATTILTPQTNYVLTYSQVWLQVLVCYTR